MAGVRTGAGGAIMVTKPRLELRRRLVQRFRPQVRGQLALFGQHRSRSISSDALEPANGVLGLPGLELRLGHPGGSVADALARLIEQSIGGLHLVRT